MPSAKCGAYVKTHIPRLSNVSCTQPDSGILFRFPPHLSAPGAPAHGETNTSCLPLPIQRRGRRHRVNSTLDGPSGPWGPCGLYSASDRPKGRWQLWRFGTPERPVKSDSEVFALIRNPIGYWLLDDPATLPALTHQGEVFGKTWFQISDRQSN
jgi:hypothetical protein